MFQVDFLKIHAGKDELEILTWIVTQPTNTSAQWFALGVRKDFTFLGMITVTFQKQWPTLLEMKAHTIDAENWS